MNDDDKMRLGDMLDTARKAQSFIEGKTRASLDEDDMLLFAVVRAIEIVGEVANQISQDTRDALPQIPWQAIIGMRNKVIHTYTGIDKNIVWDTVIYDLPPLIVQLEAILAAETDQTNGEEEHNDRARN